MSGPFDALAPAYTALWTNTAHGRQQRQQMWDHIDTTFRAASGNILDLGCGVGDDALHLAELGVRVDAIDASPRMVEIARNRGVDARVLAIENLASVAGLYAGALSNFGAVNCLAALDSLACDLANLLESGAPLALCVMGRFSWPETRSALSALDFPRATRRWKGRTHWRGIEVRYWSAREVRAAFGLHFQFIRRIPIGGGDHQLYLWKRKMRGSAAC